MRVAVYSRYLQEDQGSLVVMGDFTEVLAGKAAYDARYGIAPIAGEAMAALTRLMTGAALAAVSLAERESWGWTMTASGVSHGLFCGVEPEGMICGAVREAPSERSIVYLQRKKADGPLVESRFEPVKGEPVASVQRYFLKVEQIETRIALDGLVGVLLQSLPGGALGPCAEMTDSELVTEMRARRDAEKMKHLDDVAIFYECRCDETVIQKMIEGMPESSRAALWGEEKSLHIACPRCGREFTISCKEIAFSETSGSNVR